MTEWIRLTPPPKPGSLDDLYSRDVLQSFTPRTMPLQASRKAADEFK